MNLNSSEKLMRNSIISFCIGIAITLLILFLLTDVLSFKKEVVDNDPIVNDDPIIEEMVCDQGFINMETYCIQEDEVSLEESLDWYSAWGYCVNNYNEARLCTFGEWYSACNKNVLSNSINNYEWVDNWCEHEDVNIVGEDSCDNVENFISASDNFHAFRCCK